MKIYMLLTIIGMLFFNGCMFQKIDLPKGVIYEFKKEIEFHSFRWNGNSALFMISPHPAGLNYSMIDEMSNDTAKQLEPELKKIDGVRGIKKEINEISAGKFMGKEVVFILDMSDGTTIYQVVYLLWDNRRVWQGQFTGTQGEDLKMVHEILKSMKN